MSDEEREHADLQRRLGDVMAWIRQREGRDDRVSDELFHLVHSIEHRAAMTALLHRYEEPLVTDPHAYAAT